MISLVDFVLVDLTVGEVALHLRSEKPKGPGDASGPLGVGGERPEAPGLSFLQIQSVALSLFCPLSYLGDLRCLGDPDAKPMSSSHCP